MRRLLDKAELAAASDGTILLIGESGTGKTLLARQIHLWSTRRARPFWIIDSTRLSQQNEEGSQWNINAPATVSAHGLTPLEATDGGTIFLANVEELPPVFQARLGQFVRDRRLETAAGGKTIDVRIIAASNKDLVEEVKAHRFREDLFYLLNIISLRIPPLRQRSADILPLAARMLSAAAIRNHRVDLRLSPEASAAMTRYVWPGNVRELRNAMEAAAILCGGQTITLSDLPEAISKHALGATPSAARLEELKRQHISRVLAESPTLEQAAATLGIDVSTLWRKRKRYNLNGRPARTPAPNSRDRRH
jgi:NtrC-family two-component system response regulator AlgB